MKQKNTCKRRCWACNNSLSRALIFININNAAAFFFLVNSSRTDIVSELLLYVSLIYIHHLNHSNSTLFVDIVIPSRYNFSVTKCHTVATRWLCEGLAKSCSHRKTIGKHRVSIVLSSCGVKSPVSPMTTRSNDDGYANPQDVYTMDSRWPHGGREGHTKSHTTMHLREDLRQFFDMPKIL